MKFCPVPFSSALILRALLILSILVHLSSVALADIVEVEIKGEINEGTVITVEKAFKIAEEKNVNAILVIINTPGGLVSSTEKIVSMILNSKIPVITYVYPHGSFSASAGSFILLSGHIAAMSNGTSVGAATPVAVGLGVESVENKTVNYIASYARGIAEKRGRPSDIAEKFVTESLSLTAKEAYRLKVIDFLADSKEELFYKINKEEIEIDGRIVRVGGDVIRIDEPVQAKILSLLTNPQIATILFLIGLYGLIFGLTSPGILPETVGAISLILSLVGLGAIGINTLGILLIVAGVIFLIAELLTPTYGVLGGASVISIVLGTLFLINEPLMPKGFYNSFTMFVAGVGIGLGVLMTFLLIKVVQLKRERKKVGGEALIGEKGTVIDFESGEGLAKVRGEIWKITSEEDLWKGDEIIVYARNGLILKVRKLKKEE
jgi:membrane-bound serine protease (ClpP class)